MRLRDLLMVHGSSVTYLVDRLEEARLVERRPDPADGRVSLVCITDQGRETVNRASARLVEFQFGAIGDLGEQEREMLASLLDRLRGGSERVVEG
jgi:DNA-binding MarR family transcriptional regulator